jgi:hypothetical protein
MTASTSAARINTLLVLLVGVLSGVIIGYILGHTTEGGLPAGTPATVNLNDTIAPDDAWIVDGLTCPMPGCMNPLLVCQSDLSRRIRDWVNSQLKAGRSGESIREEIIQTHGQNLFKRGLDARTDSLSPAR